MRRTKIPAKIVVILRFVNTPIRSLFRVNHQRGTRERKPEAEGYLAVYEDYERIQSKKDRDGGRNGVNESRDETPHLWIDLLSKHSFHDRLASQCVQLWMRIT